MCFSFELSLPVYAVICAVIWSIFDRSNRWCTSQVIVSLSGVSCVYCVIVEWFFPLLMSWC
jgi:hypothetical protein